MSAYGRIYVGTKPILAPSRQWSHLSKSDSVRVMPRGRAISSAVDVVEVAKRNLLTDLVVDAIDIGTERLGEASAEWNVLTILIRLSKPKE